jgi:hypothetical protein
LDHIPIFNINMTERYLPVTSQNLLNTNT